MEPSLRLSAGLLDLADGVSRIELYTDAAQPPGPR